MRNLLSQTSRFQVVFLALFGAVSCFASAAVPPSVSTLPSPAGTFRSPARVATDAQSRLYISDPLAGKVVVLDAFGRQVFVKQGLGQPLGIAVDGAGAIYVGDAQTGAVNVFDADWNLVGQLGQGAGEFQLPGYIATTTDITGTTVYVSDGLAHTVKAYRDGVLVGQYGSRGLGPEQFDFPAGLWVAPDGNLFVVDQNNDRVQVLDQHGNFLRRFPLQTSWAQLGASGRAQGITGDAHGRLYIADAFQGHVKVFNIYGMALGTIGGQGEGAGQLRSPGGVSVDGQGRLWVANANNSRVESFGLDCFAGLTLIPGDQLVLAGTTVTFTANVGCAGSLDFQWLKDSNPISDGGTISGATNATLTLTGAAVADSGVYSVRISGPDSTSTSPAALLTVVSYPAIVAGPDSLAVVQGDTAEFAVQAQGGSLEYQWLRDDVAVSGATSGTLTLTNVQLSDGGSYSVRVSNPAGTNTSSAALLSVAVPPAIVVAPADQTAPPGSTAILSVTATGTPLNYQWFRDDIALAGETTNQLQLVNVSAAMNGVYTVTIENLGGLVSASARFAVAEPPVLATGRNPAGDLVLTWTDPFYVLETATDLNGPWQTVSGAAPYTFTVPANTMTGTPAQFFRLVRQ